MDDPDSIVLRFLRARKWSVTAGVAMVKSLSDCLAATADADHTSSVRASRFVPSHCTSEAVTDRQSHAVANV